MEYSLDSTENHGAVIKVIASAAVVVTLSTR